MDKPLLDKRIVVTRPQAQAAGFCRKLAEAGAIPIRFPTIRITPMPDTKRLDAALKRLSDYAWVVFTSVNGVAYCWDRLAVVASTRLPASLRVAAIGPATAQALRDRQHHLPVRDRGEQMLIQPRAPFGQPSMRGRTGRSDGHFSGTPPGTRPGRSRIERGPSHARAVHNP